MPRRIGLRAVPRPSPSGESTGGRASARPVHAVSPFTMDALESRLAMSATVVDGVLRIEGTGGGDVISISAGDGVGIVVLRGVAGVADGTPFAGVNRVSVQARSGNDTITVLGTPRDTLAQLLRFTIQGGNGTDTIQGGSADDTLGGGNGRDTIRGGTGNDDIKGGKGNDFLDGQSGDDAIEGYHGHDTLLGGPGDDSLRGGSGDDALRGGSDDDLIRGGYGEDDVYGGAGDDLLFGDRDRDVLRGLLEEFGDFNREDANGFDVIDTNPERGTLSDFFWSELDEIVGEGDMTDDQVTATTTLQLLRARSADEGDEFDDEFGDLPSGLRNDIIDDSFDTIDEYLDDMYDNPSDINEFSVEALRRAMEGFFPGGVRGDYNEYMEAFVELDDDLEEFGNALDEIENDGDKDPWFREFEAFFEL